ncbi:uncharacterized protein LOC122051788 [Zingiber officinale]|uniref:Uncharacterized protein n=1 Tax=Zingiber officinale TaxID=94328 RepID=A0A8J5LLR6_ZINOF|nr:uncharacterized protein LOC122051788 [Zingiber officinale]KAG6520904.1 hypothetical protein ZIOFF_017966 [Zingiber officinale]
MERSEPALVPQWYKLANGSSSNKTLRTSTSKRSDENGVEFGSRDKLLRDQDRNLRRSLSSNSSVDCDRSSFGKSPAYSSFRRSCDKKQKNFDYHDRENRSYLVHSGFDYHDSSVGVRAKNDATRSSHSMVTGRQFDSWPKRLGSSWNNPAPPRECVVGSIDDFPSLQTKMRQSFSDADDALSLGPKTAVESLRVAAPVIIGTSALAEVPVKVETNGSLVSSVTGRTMARTLAHTPTPVGNTLQSSVDTQRIEELTIKKCKQLIPMTHTLPKSLSVNVSEKTKMINAKGGAGDFSFTKVGQQMNLPGRPPARSDIAKTLQVGNFQVLFREKNSILPAAKDGSSVSKIINHAGLAPSAAVPSTKNQADLKLRVDEKNGALTRVSVGERKLLSRAQNRNDFFNLLRKKSLTTSSSILESGSIEAIENLHSSSLDNVQKNGHQGLDCSAENGSFTNEGCLSTDETDRLYADNEKTKSFLDGGIDPEEEAFLQSLGWDKNAGEEALTQEEIDSFLNKYESQRRLKISIS